MTLEQNIRAVLDSCFAGHKDEIIDVAEKKIMELINDAEQAKKVRERDKRKLLEVLEKDDATYWDFFKALIDVASQEPKCGKWAQKKDYQWSRGTGMGEAYGFYYECSECGKWERGGYLKCDMNFCPNCGADMRAEPTKPKGEE